MKKTLYFLFVALVLSQCRPDVIEDFEPFGSQESAIRSLLQQASDPTSDTVVTLVAPTDDTVRVRTQLGTQLIVPFPDDTFLDEQGQVVSCKTCQDLKITVKEVLTNRQTVAEGLTLQSSAIDVAQTTGAIYVEVRCNGKLLAIETDKEIFVQIPYANPDSNMLAHTSILDQKGYVIDWEFDPSNQIFKYKVIATGNEGYEFKLKKLGWTIGFKPIQGLKTTLCLDMTPKYNAENTFAYFILDGARASIRMPFNVQTGQFCLEGVPQGVGAQVLIVSKIGDKWHSELQSINTSSSQITIEPKQTTDAEVVESVRNL